MAIPGVSVYSAKIFLKVNFILILDTYHEKIRKSKVPKMVILGRKPKPLAHCHFSTDLKDFYESETYETCATSIHK